MNKRRRGQMIIKSQCETNKTIAKACNDKKTNSLEYTT